MRRLFFAISVPGKHKHILIESFSQQNLHGIRWVSLENLHITTHFLGATPGESLKDILEQMPSVCNSITPFDITFQDFIAVFKDKKPVMIWAQFQENKAYDSLCYSLRKAFPTQEKRIPVPHLTLARIKQLRQLPFELPKIKSFYFPVNSIELWESYLGESGSTYTMLSRWKLNG